MSRWWEPDVMDHYYRKEQNDNDNFIPHRASSTLLYQSSCPMRCVSILPTPITNHNNNNNNNNNSSDDATTATSLVVGSNDRYLRLINYYHTTTANGIQTEIIREWENIHKGSVYCCDITNVSTSNTMTNNDNGDNYSNVIVATGSNDKMVKLTR